MQARFPPVSVIGKESEVTGSGLNRRSCWFRATSPALPWSWASTSLTTHVFPVSRLALGNPVQRGLDALVTRLFAFGFRDPLDVFPLMARTEIFKRGQRPGVLF